ncbi:MAG TPA: metallopeptidase family protein [Roseimicrobium sp.]|nr:metallopeptidase family protein [Roseimicrobium sp.]
MPPVWKHLMGIAQDEVGKTLGQLPSDLRKSAQEVPVVFEPKPNAELIADGLDADLLGLFVGESFVDMEHGTASPLPPQILLFLENLWDFAEGDENLFREEVRITFMHELGHFLGLNEEDLEDRGLD